MKQNALDSKVWKEIVSAMSTCIMFCTMILSPEEIGICCEQHIENHPVLKDIDSFHLVS